MKIALIGLPQVGKKTVFSLLTGVSLDHLLGRAAEYHVGTVKVADPRVDKLSAMYNPKKTKYAEIEVTLAPAPPQQTKSREQWLEKLKAMDALCHIVRVFDRDTDPQEDVNKIDLELAISDLSLIENRLNRITQDQKKKFDQDRANEAELLERLKPHLEAGKPLRDYPWHEGEEKKVRSLQFLTLKPLVTAFNGGTGEVAGNLSCRLDAKTEAEVAEIEDPKERAEFLTALGIAEPALHVLTRLLYKALGYISFFTTGEDEVRAWTIRQGSTAVDAAHAIHSDLARGFIRAEVVHWADFAEHKDIKHCRDAGKFKLEGKGYIVQDGDMVVIRFAV